MSDAGKPYTIICLGDSITKGERPGVQADQIYEAVLERLLSEQGVHTQVVASGIGSEQTDGSLGRFDCDIIGCSPDCVTIMYGTNDSYVYEEETQPHLTPDEYTANLRKMLGLATAAGIQVVLMSPIPMSATGSWMAWSPYKEEGPNCRIGAYVEAVVQLAADEDLPIVDNYSVWLAQTSGTSQTIDDLTTDGCHPNPAGHELIGQTMLPVLAQVISVKGSRI